MNLIDIKTEIIIIIKVIFKNIFYVEIKLFIIIIIYNFNYLLKFNINLYENIFINYI